MFKNLFKGRGDGSNQLGATPAKEPSLEDKLIGFTNTHLEALVFKTAEISDATKKMQAAVSRPDATVNAGIEAHVTKQAKAIGAIIDRSLQALQDDLKTLASENPTHVLSVKSQENAQAHLLSQIQTYLRTTIKGVQLGTGYQQASDEVKQRENDRESLYKDFIAKANQDPSIMRELRTLIQVSASHFYHDLQRTVAVSTESSSKAHQDWNNRLARGDFDKSFVYALIQDNMQAMSEWADKVHPFSTSYQP